MTGTLGVFFSLLISIGFPLLVLILCILRPKWRGYVKPYLLGVATFLVFQQFIRIPLLQHVLPGQSWYTLFQIQQPILFIILIGGVSAGLFEEGGRFAAMHLLKPEQRTVRAAIFFGIGHGGVEAVLIGVQLISSWLQASVLLSVKPFFITAITGVERALAMGLHVGLSVLVMEAVRRKRWWLVLVSIAIHGAANSATVLVGRVAGVWLGELAFVPFAAAMVVYAVVMYKRERRTEVSI